MRSGCRLSARNVASGSAKSAVAAANTCERLQIAYETRHAWPAISAAFVFADRGYAGGDVLRTLTRPLNCSLRRTGLPEFVRAAQLLLRKHLLLRIVRSRLNLAARVSGRTPNAKATEAHAVLLPTSAATMQRSIC